MNWNKGFTATYYATVVDPATWRDVERFEIIEGSVSRANTGLRQSADITCRDYDPARENWIRIYLDARQGDSGAHEAIFTGLATSPEISVNGNVKAYPLQCFSVLKPAEDIYLERGWYAPAGASGAKIVHDLLSVCPCPIEVEEDSPILSQAIVAEDSETYLTMIDKVLKAINWRLRVHGDGRIEVRAMARESSVTFDVLENDSIEPAITLTHDWYQCPNCFRAIRNDMTGIAKDEDEDSPLSVINRGREVWRQETSCELANDESIAEYAVRALKEAQEHYMTIKYDRRFHPALFVSDLVRLHYPAQGVDGEYMVTSQSIDLSYGARTSEEVSSGRNEEYSD